MFRLNPHLYEAYKTFGALEDVIEQNFRVHSKEIRTFAANIYKGLDLEDDTGLDSMDANLAHMRRSLVAYILSTIVWPNIEGTPLTKLTIPGTNLKTTLSIGRSYSENVAEDINAIRKYAIDHRHNNAFLNYISVNRDEFNVMRITFKGGVNLNSADIESIVKGFMNLNAYDIVDGVVTYTPGRFSDTKSAIQSRLLEYAVINYGLQFSSTNYSNYIPASMFKDLDIDLDNTLRHIMDWISESDPRAAALGNQFRLAYAVQQGDRLPFVSRERTKPFYSYINPGSEKSINSYNGVEKVGETMVYYDRKITKDPRSKPDAFMKVAYDNRINVFKLVFSDDNYHYYQVVGKTSDIFFSPLPHSDFYGNPVVENYISSNYFNPFELTLLYSDISTNLNELKIGDEVKITSLTSVENPDGKSHYLEVGQEF